MTSIVMDSFSIVGRTAAEYGATGVVVVFKLESASSDPHQGDGVVVIRPDGWFRILRIGEVREHGGRGRSFFLEGVTKDDIPIGTQLNWGASVERLHDLQGLMETSAT